MFTYEYLLEIISKKQQQQKILTGVQFHADAETATQVLFLLYKIVPSPGRTLPPWQLVPEVPSTHVFQNEKQVVL
jgi:hypothetical protein